MVNVAPAVRRAVPTNFVQMKDAIDSVKGLDALSHVVITALHSTSDPNSDIMQVARLISLDQVLAGRILGMANSALRGGVRRITGVKDAVARLGYRAVREVLLTTAVSGVLERPSALYGLARGELWRHSVASAFAARLIAEHVGAKDKESAYFVGLLHDIGIIVIDRVATKDQANAIRQSVISERKAFFEAELPVLGFDHASVGAMLLHKWKLPEEFGHHIAAHHSPTSCLQDQLASIVHVADAVSLIACNISGPGWSYAVSSPVLAGLGLSYELIPPIIKSVKDSLAKTESSIRA